MAAPYAQLHPTSINTSLNAELRICFAGCNAGKQLGMVATYHSVISWRASKLYAYTETIIEMRSLLGLMKSENAPRYGSLMEKAVCYLDHFWNRVFLYKKDGNYTIDNSLAERCIRPLANGRKNSLFFGSHKMAHVSAAYHSLVSTCKLQGYSILEYLKKFFAEIVAGNRDYGKLMPSTIGISANKL